MSVLLWLVAGGLVGWIAYSLLNMSERRGQAISIIIGAMGGVLGGKLVAPMFVAASSVPGAFSAPTLAIAGLVAAALLVVGNLIHDMWGI